MVLKPRGIYEYLVVRCYSAKRGGNGVCVCVFVCCEAKTNATYFQN